jgi:hypothetical protein
VLTVDGKTFLLRCEFETQEWELCSEYDGAELMSRPSIELIALDAETVHKAEKLMSRASIAIPMTRTFRSIGSWRRLSASMGSMIS